MTTAPSRAAKCLVLDPAAVHRVIDQWDAALYASLPHDERRAILAHAHLVRQIPFGEVAARISADEKKAVLFVKSAVRYYQRPENVLPPVGEW